MDYIRMENNAILFENDGEVLRIEPWGKDSLRVRAAMMREIQDTDLCAASRRGNGSRHSDKGRLYRQHNQRQDYGMPGGVPMEKTLSNQFL
ncbi:MAG: hypothetical protein ACLVLH_26460 [Eisenbergiella massiliensis]